MRLFFQNDFAEDCQAFGRDRVSYFFSGKPMTQAPSFSLEERILYSIQRNNTHLEFYKTMGTFPTPFFCQEQHPVYRLKSVKYQAYYDFEVLPYESGGLLCNTMILVIAPQAQGNFFTLKTFLIGEVAKTLFDADNEIMLLRGRAVENQYPVRSKRNKRGDWRNQTTSDGATKIVRLYERLGFFREHPKSNGMILLSEKARQQFAKSDSPEKRLMASKQGMLAHRRSQPDGQPGKK
jgi:hypothetical protein